MNPSTKPQRLDYENASDELSEEDLESVQGGIIVFSLVAGPAVYAIGAIATAILIYIAIRTLRRKGIIR